MPGPDITELFTASTREEILDLMYTIATSLDLPVTSWQRLAVARTLLATVAQKFADFSGVIALIIRSGFLDYATGAWLKLLAKNVYGVDIAGPTFAQGAVTITNASAGTYGPFAAGAFHVANTITGKTYKNADAFSIGATTSFAINVTADEIGSASSSGPATIDALATPLIGVSVSNAAAVLGSDGQSEDEIRVACRAKLAALSPGGANDAYNFIAIESPTSAQITRSTTRGDIATGLVTVTIATATGAPTGGDVAIVQAEIDAKAEPSAVLATAMASTEALVAVSGTAWISRQEGLTAGVASNKIAVAIANYLKTIPIGGVEFGGSPPGMASLEMMRAAAVSANPKTLDVQFTTPGANVNLTGTDVPKLGTFTMSIVFQ